MKFFITFSLLAVALIVTAAPKSGPLCGLLCGLEKYFNPISPDPPFYDLVQLPNVTVEREDLEEAEGVALSFVNFMLDCSEKPDLNFLKARATRKIDKKVELPWRQHPGSYNDLSTIVDQMNNLSKSLQKAANSRAGYKNYNVDKMSLQRFVAQLKELHVKSKDDILKQKSINLVCRDLHTLCLYMKVLYKPKRSKTIGTANVQSAINFSDY